MRKHFPKGSYPELGKDILWPTDLMVLKVKKGKNGKPPKIEQFMGEVSDYTFGPPQNVYCAAGSGEVPEPDGAARYDEPDQAGRRYVLRKRVLMVPMSARRAGIFPPSQENNRYQRPVAIGRIGQWGVPFADPRAGGHPQDAQGPWNAQSPRGRQHARSCSTTRTQTASVVVDLCGANLRDADSDGPRNGASTAPCAIWGALIGVTVNSRRYALRMQS